MTLLQITAPVAKPVTLAEVKKHLNIETGDFDDVLNIYIGSAVANLDGRDGWLGRALTEQTWELRVDSFHVGSGCGEIKLPLPPLKSVGSVKYIDLSGTLQTVDPTLYQTTGGGFGKSVLSPVYGQFWPATRFQREGVRIQYTCGYGATGCELLPDPIKHGLLLAIGGSFENREALTTEQLLELPALKALLLPYRLSWF